MKTLIQRRIATRRLDRIARVASPKTIFPIALATSLVLRNRPGAARLAAGTAIAVAAEEITKRVVDRHRPRFFSSSAWRSFPSGHSAGTTAFLLGLALMAPRSKRPYALGAVACGVLGVNWLRIVARNHWTSDVVAGDALGALSVAASQFIRRGPAFAPRLDTL